MQSKYLAAILVLILVVNICCGTDSPQRTVTATAKSIVTISGTEQIEALKKEADDAEAAYLKTFNNTNREELWARFCKINDSNLPQVYKLAEQESQSETALDAFEWILLDRRIHIHTLYTNGLQTIELIRDYHALNPRIAKICKNLGNNWDPTLQPIIDLLHRAADHNPNPEVRGQATLALARFAKDKASILADWESDTNSVNSWYAAHKTFIIEGEKSGGSPAALLEAEKYCHVILENYRELPTLQPTNAFQLRKTLGELAKIELFELEHLTVGKMAPEIEGEDVNGKKLKLSDYHGKVVVLSFWASWCGPCMQMVPSEAKLIERMKNKPFALIGINGDSNRDDAKHAAQKENMSWPSFWNSGGSDGSIPTSWSVRGWPTVFVLDGNGVIQLKFEGFGGTNTENLLNQKIDSLISKLAAKSEN